MFFAIVAEHTLEKSVDTLSCVEIVKMKNKTIVVWFSCGAASAVAAKLTLDVYGKNNKVIICNNPIKEEHPDNERFLRDFEKFIGQEIILVRSEKYPSQSCVEVWEDRRFMSGPTGAPCTGELKKKARQQWEAKNPHDYIVLGLTLEEKHRHERFKLTERENILPVLIDCMISKTDCYKLINEWGLRLPEVYSLGLPNANCLGCVKATSPTYWNLVRKIAPEAFKERAKQSREIGARLVRVKGERIFLDELDPEAKGRPLKNMDFECGIFCEENKNE